MPKSDTPYADMIMRGPDAKPLPHHVEQFRALPRHEAGELFADTILDQYNRTGRTYADELTRRYVMNEDLRPVIEDMIAAAVNCDYAHTLLGEMG